MKTIILLPLVLANPMLKPSSKLQALPERKVGGQCMTLINSKACPEQNGLSIPITTAFSDTTSFDAFVNSHLDSAPGYVGLFQESYFCPEYNGTGQQFHLTFYCSLLAQPTAQCSSQTPAIPLCKSTCTAATTTLSNVFSSICTSNQNSDATSARSQTLSVYNNFCNTLTINTNTNGNCLDGSLQPQENTTCGFSSNSQAISFCTGTTNPDPCCTRVINLPNTNQTTNSTTENTSSCGTGIFQNTCGVDGKSLGIPNIVFGLMMTILIVVLITIALLTYRYMKNKKSISSRRESFRPKSFVKTDMSDQPIMRVTSRYEPKMVDELQLNPNDQIVMIESYDDGWAFGRNIETGVEGTFPLVCTTLERKEV